MAEQLKTLKHKRGAIKTQLTLFNKYFESVKKETLTEQTILNLEKRLAKIEPHYDTFNEIQTEIELLDPNESYQTREEFTDTFFEITSKAEQEISKFRLKLMVNNTNSAAPSEAATALTNVRLPLINLPTFDGDFTRWREFFDSFKAMVHNNKSISDAQKLSYLKSSLKSEPANLLISFETCDANYSIAWQLLQERYENKRRIVRTHVRALLEIPTIQKESHVLIGQLIDTAEKHIRCLKNLNQSVDQWDALIVPILEAKLDPITSREWESKLNSGNLTRDDIPTFKEFITFLNQQRNTLESLATTKAPIERNKSFSFTKKRETHVNSFSVSNAYCQHCKGGHFLYACDKFLELNINDRIDKIKQLHLCLNCLRKGHFSPDCKSRHSCKFCHKKHNSLLHIPTENKKEQENESLDRSHNAQKNEVVANCVSGNSCTNIDQVLLSTAMVDASNNNGKTYVIKALLDSASQSNFITEELSEKLNLKRTKIDASVVGINQNCSKILFSAELNIKSRCNNYNITLPCLIIPKITEQLPMVTFNTQSLDIPKNIKLADPAFNESHKIELLIGSSIFWNLLCVGQIKLNNECLTLQKTKLGWVLAGQLKGCNTNNTSQNTISCISLETLQNEITKFWEVDEFLTKTPHKTAEEKYCESFFQETTSRDQNGSFIVRIPFKPNFKELGESKHAALKRLYSLEQKLNHNNKLKSLYNDFMSEYQQLNHMSNINNNQTLSFFLPHHGVLNESKETTKLRVVFDGSARSDSGLSLNEVQFVGPTIQNDLFSIILRFRTHAFVITADISKMYRQILVHPDDRKFQQILWRNNKNDEVEMFELNTVTYGTASAPFLAIRSLFQLALDYETIYPKECNIIKNDFYVDDLLTGANSLQEVKTIRDNITTILKTANFPLHKWHSNNTELLSQNKSQPYVAIDNASIKTLGIKWNPNSDSFAYSIHFSKVHNQVTKRTILSTTAQLFDPLGLLAPIIIVPKLILQELWQLKLGWDESIPASLHSKWLSFKDNLKFVNDIQIPRHALGVSAISTQIHGFSDASERGYGACVYIRTVNDQNNISVRLLAAKSRVAPVKNISLPKLELCAAVVLAQLIEKIRKILDINFDSEFLWCDSTIVLSWIASPPSKWKTYVANRVAEIQSLTNARDWYHVASKDNPADLISRGTTPKILINSPIWWSGPEMLHSEFVVPSGVVLLEQVPEIRSTALSATINNNFDIFTKFSSLNKLINVFSFCHRFCNNAKLKPNERNFHKVIQPDERAQTLLKMIMLAQQQCFMREIKAVKKANQCNADSKLLSLHPFLDNQDILRVGGRLSNATIAYDNQHQIILPPHHPLTYLIARHEHNRLLHSGSQALLHSLREKYWPIGARNLTKKVCHQCIICFKTKPKLSKTLMGNLPKDRVTPSPPFQVCGVDYAGPFLTRDRRARGYKSYKCYICLFVCFSTKAIHIALVSDLTSECFLAALKRFIARRGKPQKMYSDNGTTFVGANSEMKEFYNFLKLQSEQIQGYSSNEGIFWSFIPARSPHFGGIWEAGIKSVKTNLKRVVGTTILTFESFSTLLTQIEATLNSRPLSPLSNDPSDLNPPNPRTFPYWKILNSSSRARLFKSTNKSAITLSTMPTNVSTFLATLASRISP